MVQKFHSNDEAGTDAILSAIEASYRFIKTAYNYKNEANVGEAIKLSGISRKEFYISTKVGFQDIIDGKTKEKVHESAKNLGLNQIDLVLLDWPATNFVKAYKDLLGLQKDGVSNFQVRHLETLEKEGLVNPVVNQIELHPYFQGRELKEYCERKDIVIETWSLLGGRDNHIFEDEIVKNIA